ncbi:MAG: site-specific DNA-methyltransferase [Planctomycetes bacterium]|nr:site-specific DNA-methyltransferase [Planctomycetota bacterium]
MSKIEDLIAEIGDPRLRDEIAREVAALKKQKKFGLVFEEHIPEQVQLPGLPVKEGLRVVRRGGNNKEVFTVEEVLAGGKARIRRENGDAAPEPETAKASDLVVVKRFGEPVYPALVPVARLTRAPGKPYHTLINADNFHALQLLLYCYAGQVDVIYIDPPYNTGARDWKYNNDYVDDTDGYRHSKWLSMMKKRLLLARRLLKPHGVLIVTIDDNEVHHLALLVEEIFPDRLRHLVTIVINPGGTYKINFARVHEYALFVCPPDVETVQGRPVSEDRPGVSSDEEVTYDVWKLRRTGAESAHRHQRPKQFYPIYVDSKTLKVKRVGKEVASDQGFNLTGDGDELPVYPIDGRGVERVWRYGRETMAQRISEGAVIAKRVRGVVNLYLRVPVRKTRRIKTVWYEGQHSSVGTASTVLVDTVLGRPNAFPFPKSLYAVRDTLATVCRSIPDALIVDFFAGSGTTYHATALLNAQDNGRRRCILVTNNEVTEKLGRQLTDQGLLPGDEEFERHGICEGATWPRCRFVTQGHRDDGTDLPGEYFDGGELKAGFEENIEYFKLDFLDPHEVAYGEKFEAIVPILWLMAGAKGERETARGYGKWFIPKESPFAVLIREEHFADFRRELEKRPDIAWVFLVTDSEEAYREMVAALPGRPQTKMLYKSYLENFRINTEKSL